MKPTRSLRTLGLATAVFSLCACDLVPTGAVLNGVGSETVSVDSTQPRGRPVLVAVLPSRGARGTLAVTGANQGVVTFQTADGISLSLDDGLLVSTRGLGQDLMSAQAEDARLAVLSRVQGASYPRIHAYLDGINRIRYTTYSCETSTRQQVVEMLSGENRGSTRVEEECSTPERTFTNTYWVTDIGAVIKSRQWISDDLGYVELERL